MIDYKVVLLEDVKHIDSRYNWYEANEYEYVYALVLYKDDVPTKIIGTDGGEPEDQSLVRDWSWISMALKDAYELGYKAGNDCGLKQGWTNGMNQGLFPHA